MFRVLGSVALLLGVVVGPLVFLSLRDQQRVEQYCKVHGWETLQGRQHFCYDAKTREVYLPQP